MAASSFFLLLSGFISLFVCLYAESSFPVPVFIWSKDSNVNSASPVLAGHTIKERDFREKYLSKLFNAPQIIGVFLQDRLSIDDISRYGDAYSVGNHGDAFSNLKVAMETANSSAVLPSVEVSSSGGKSDELVQLMRELANGLVKEFTPEESSKFEISQFSLDKGKSNVFIFHLHPASSSTPAEILAQNDKLIGAITHQISSTGVPYSCILTAAAPSEAIYERQLSEKRSTMAHDRLRRAAEEDNKASVDADAMSVNGSMFVNGGCVLLYSKGFTFKVGNVSVDVFNETGLTYTVKPQCQNTSDSIMISFKGPSSINKLDLSFSFNSNDSEDEWKCTEASLDVDGTFDDNKIKEKLTYNCSNKLTGPSIYSYSCGTVTLKNKRDSITFKNFQVQPFHVKNGTFEYAYDCAGFFTIPIFMGLITAGILLIILFFAVMAMFSLTTFDRFDDPKGPGIHVPTG